MILLFLLTVLFVCIVVVVVLCVDVHVVGFIVADHRLGSEKRRETNELHTPRGQRHKKQRRRTHKNIFGHISSDASAIESGKKHTGDTATSEVLPVRYSRGECQRKSFVRWDATNQKLIRSRRGVAKPTCCDWIGRISCMRLYVCVLFWWFPDPH